MRTQSLKNGVLAFWTLAIGLLGYAGGVTSVAGLMTLLVLACVPPLVILHFWGVPSQSMSETIQKVLR